MSDLFPSRRQWRELLASMRFAIALLMVICIASVIGTVLRQHEPAVNYVNQFGPFWAELFLALQLNAVYSAWWFLLILAFLVTSTSLCVARHAPKYLKDIRLYKENIRIQNLQAFHHKAQADMPEVTPEAAVQRIGQSLVSAGWQVRLQQREAGPVEPAGWMVAAKTGAAGKLGYIAAHSAIVLICIGGLLDGDLFIRAQMWFAGKTPYAGGGMVADVPAQHRLSQRTPAFRGNLFVAEGTHADTAILSQSDGVLLQALPFAVELKQFIVDYYPTGMPKTFASEIVIHDKATGAQTPARVEVNHPARYGGMEIYQSSFDDGGSLVRLRARPMQADGEEFEVQGSIGSSTQLTNTANDGVLTLEYSALRVLNVENLADAKTTAVDPRKVDLRSSIEARLGAGHKTVTPRELRNIGPSITYKLRDAAGQAREFHNFMRPVDMGEGPVYLLGVRDNPADAFRYLRVPADSEGGMDDFFRLRQALGDIAWRTQAAQRYAALVLSDDSAPEIKHQFIDGAQRMLALFAAQIPTAENPLPQGGFVALAEHIQNTVHETEREQASQMLIRMVAGTLHELAQALRSQAGLPPLPLDANTQQFMAQMLWALSDAHNYPAPMVFELHSFDQVQASVFQIARAPGKHVVYLGCALLILGIFAMLYVRERRVWVWLTAAEHGGTQATMALSTNRQTLDTEREFVRLSRHILNGESA